MRRCDTRTRTSRAVLGLGACLMVAGCATTAKNSPIGELTPEQRTALLVTDTEPNLGQGCMVSTERPYAFSMIVDSAVVHEAIARRWEGGDAPAGHALFSVAVDSTGAPWQLALLEGDLPDSLGTALRDVLSDHVKPLPQHKGWSARIWIEAGAAPRFRVGQPVTCRPFLLNRNELRSFLQEEVDALQKEGSLKFDGAKVAVVRIKVSAQAVIEEVRVYRSSGEPKIDALAMRVALRAHFAPASNDRVPVGVWNEMPISVRMPSASRAAGRDSLPPIPE